MKSNLGMQRKATVNARYFFDAPVSDVEVHWALYTKPDTFYLPNYETGVGGYLLAGCVPLPGGFGSDYFGRADRGRNGSNDPAGDSCPLSCQPSLKRTRVRLVTLEVTAQDESGLAGQRAGRDARPSRRFLHRLAPRSMDRPRRYADRF